MTAPIIDTRAGFVTAIGWAFRTAIDQGARRIVCVDSEFVDWPWDDAATLDALGVWLRQPQRRLELLARRYDDVPRRSPRFNSWRRDWSHAITAWQVPDDWTPVLPTVLVADVAVSVQLIDAVHWRGRADIDARIAQRWREAVDVVLQRSEPAFAVRTLGL